MELLRAIVTIKPFKLDAVVEALGPFAVGEIEVSEVRGYGRQKGHLELYAGREYELNFLPKVRVEFCLELARQEQAVAALRDAAFTGRIGDGKLFLLPVEATDARADGGRV